MSNDPILFDVDMLTSQILPKPSPPADDAKMTNPREFQPSTLHGSKALEALLV